MIRSWAVEAFHKVEKNFLTCSLCHAMVLYGWCRHRLVPPQVGAATGWCRIMVSRVGRAIFLLVLLAQMGAAAEGVSAPQVAQTESQQIQLLQGLVEVPASPADAPVCRPALSVCDCGGLAGIPLNLALTQNCRGLMIAKQSVEESGFDAERQDYPVGTQSAGEFGLGAAAQDPFIEARSAVCESKFRAYRSRPPP